MHQKDERVLTDWKFFRGYCLFALLQMTNIPYKSHFNPVLAPPGLTKQLFQPFSKWSSPEVNTVKPTRTDCYPEGVWLCQVQHY